LALAYSHIDRLAGTYQNMPWLLWGNILKGHGQARSVRIHRGTAVLHHDPHFTLASLPG
jgi:hypothetical protein